MDGVVEGVRCRSRRGVCYRSMFMRWAFDMVDN